MKRKVQNKTEGLNESIKNLEEGKDYVNVHDNSVIVIDRLEILENRGFEGREYKNYLSCSNPKNWREATKEEVIEAFEKHLPHRFGEDWETMKIKKRHPNQFFDIDDSSWNVEISRDRNGWRVWNKHGLLYRNGFWVERLEEEKKITIQEATKENTVINCETEEEAERILGIAHELGYKWCTGENYENNTEWSIYKSKICYDLFTGSYASNDYFMKNDYTIIPSTQIANLIPKPTDWSPSPEDIELMNKKASEKLLIDKVTTRNLDIALRMVGIQLDINIIDKVIDLVELIENKGDDVTIKDIASLQQTW